MVGALGAGRSEVLDGGLSRGVQPVLMDLPGYSLYSLKGERGAWARVGTLRAIPSCHPNSLISPLDFIFGDFAQA